MTQQGGSTPSSKQRSAIFAVTLEAAQAAARSMLDSSEVHDVRKVPSFAMNRVFRVVSGPLVTFLKFAPAQDLRREMAVLDLLARHDVPAPTVAAVDLSAELVGAPCVLLRQIGGHPLGGEEPELNGAGRLLRRVHGVAVSGFGSLRATDGRLVGEDGTWADTVRKRCSGLGSAIDAGLVPGELIRRAIAAVSRQEHLLTRVTSARLLHGDFHPRHVYAAGGTITGIIDWGDATAGDPLYDLGRLLYSGLSAGDVTRGLALVDAALQTYGTRPDGLRQTPELLFTYAAVFSLWSMTGELEGGAPWPPWWPAQCAALARATEEIERRCGPA